MLYFSLSSNVQVSLGSNPIGMDILSRRVKRPSSVKGRNEWALTPTPLYAFMVLTEGYFT